MKRLDEPDKGEMAISVVILLKGGSSLGFSAIRGWFALGDGHDGERSKEERCCVLFWSLTSRQISIFIFISALCNRINPSERDVSVGCAQIGSALLIKIPRVKPDHEEPSSMQ